MSLGAISLAQTCSGRVGAGAACGLRGELVFVDQPAEQVTAADTIEFDHVGDRWLAARRTRSKRWPLRECAVRPVLVVMQGVVGHDVPEMSAAEDQEPVDRIHGGRSRPSARRAPVPSAPAPAL
jgi:hypothetical protein